MRVASPATGNTTITLTATITTPRFRICTMIIIMCTLLGWGEIFSFNHNLHPIRFSTYIQTYTTHSTLWFSDLLMTGQKYATVLSQLSLGSLPSSSFLFTPVHNNYTCVAVCNWHVQSIRTQLGMLLMKIYAMDQYMAVGGTNRWGQINKV